jgi:Adenylate kinase and related kinases
MVHVIIFGAPGAGKGTQSSAIEQRYHLEHLSTGDLLRQEIARQSPLGQRVQNIIAQGHLVDDDTIIDLIANELHNLPKGVEGVIFDGFPRTVAQAEALDALLEHENDSIDCLIELDVPKEELEVRLLNRAKIEGRADDTPEVIADRIRVYNERTLPIVDYYRRKGLHHQVPGSGSIEEISKAIFEAIDLSLQQ